jgi:exopolyphosphatase/guanosine-5'-triphosphate,3'-diphosphate pyrophosphatase
VTRRYAALDVGTNSVKLHVGELLDGGEWRTVLDRSELTRLGEGVAQTGRLGEEPIRRTVAVVEELADAARRDGAETIVAVGTAGLRQAANSNELLDAVRERTGIEVEVIPGEEEARLSYLAATAVLAVGEGKLGVFETGGGSSQFTFGEANRIDERFSLDVGAVAITERFGLDRAADRNMVGAAKEAIARELGPLEGRPALDVLVGIGGAITNLAGVRLRLERYDPERVRGLVLEAAEVSRQIELYRTRDAEARRSIVGLQPRRAEVILAGACIVRVVLGQLGRDSLTVSDEGLRHGVLIERFGRR